MVLHMAHRFQFLFLSLILVLINGCGGVSKPEGFPNLVRPVTVKLHKDGVPLNGISVILHSKGSDLHYTVSGQTGANGVATLQTSRGTYIMPGVPTGKYLIQLSEAFQVDIRQLSMDATPQEAVAWQKEFDEKADKLRSFPRILGHVVNSPLEIEVASSPVAVEFDVSQY